MKKLLILAALAGTLVFIDTWPVSSTSICSSPSFSAPVSLRTGGNSDLQAIVVGDLNNDGRNDVVTANGSSNSISVLLAAGDSYLPAVNFPAGAVRPFSVAIGDLNNDTKADVVTVNVISHNLSVMLGDGVGGFTTTTQIDGGPDPINVITADFNGDNNLDLAVTNGSPATVNILLGNGSGGFASSLTIPTESGPSAQASADFNLDGKVDLAVANSGANNVSVLLGSGTGNFQRASTPSVGTTPNQIVNGDFNGDGKPDLAVANLNSSSVSILIGLGDGTFEPAIHYDVGSPVTSIVISDFNNDAHLDLAMTSNSGGVAVRFGNGSGSFNDTPKVTRALGPLLLAIDDFNRDGISDVVAAGRDSGTVVPLAGDGQGSFFQTPTHSSGVNTFSIALADFNSDGKLDSVTANENTNSVSVRFGDGTNAFGNANNFAVGTRPFWVGTGDFNSDNKPDIVTANFLAGLSILINDGTGNFETAVPVGLGSPPFNPLFVAVSDVNNDNKPDLLAIRLNVHAITILLGDGGGGFGAPIDYPTAPNPQTLAVGDFNGDNKLDLAVAENSFSILLGDGLGAFSAPLNTNFGENSGPSEIVARDFNGDGRLDIALANMFTNEISVLLGNGNATFAPRVNFKVGTRPVSLKAGDFNGDGILDLVTGNNISASLTVLVGDGAGSFGSATDWAVPTSPTSLAVGDLNDDSRLDITAVGFNTLAVLINQCGLTEPTPTALLTINDITFVEGNSGVTDAAFTVSLNSPSAQTVTAKFIASSITAQRVADFQPTTGLVSFAPGETSMMVFVGIVGDTIDEFDEKVALNLYEPTNALIADRQGVATITDNDGPPSISINNASALESSTTLSLPVTLSEPSGKLVSVAYATASGTATAGMDFVSKSGTLNIPSGSLMRSIVIDLIDDTAVEPDEIFTVSLSEPFNVSISQGTGTGTIRDDDLPTVQLSANAFNADEGTELSIGVTRSGNTSGETFISYATTDGTANDRHDYTAALGRLRFAPEEINKTIRVLITDDVFNDDGETFTISLSAPVGGILGSQNNATILVNDNDSANAISPVRDANFNAEFYVRQHYADFLNRTSDTEGLSFWVNQVTNCGNPDLLVCRINVSAAFFLSIEFQETGYLVYRTHKTAFGNLGDTPVPIRLRPFVADARQIGEGVQVGIGNWEDQLEASKVAYFNEFITRTEFTTHYSDMSNAMYVDALNVNAGGVLVPAQRDELVNNLDEGRMSRAQVLRAVADTETLKTNEFNKAFVLLQYFGYLRRDPDALPDSNFDGYNFWLGKLIQFNGHFIDAEMVKAFIQSSEYADRFGQ